MNMARYIDADALVSALNNGRLKEQTGRAVPFNAGVAFALTMVEYAQTIDAVPATIDGALGYLHKVGWIQEHDRIMTEDVAPVRHGRWVESFKVNAPPTLRSRWTCSWCGNVQTYGTTDYCPNCGARMDGDSDE